MTWLTLRSTWGFNLNHVHQSLSLRLIECAHHNVLLEYGELPCVLPYAVHLDLGYCPDTQGYLGLLSGPYIHLLTPFKSFGCVVVVGWPKILVSAPVPLELI